MDESVAMNRGSMSKGRTAVRIVIAFHDALGVLLAVNLWWLRLSGRLAGDVDAAEIVLLYAIATGVVAVLALTVTAIASIAKSVTARWLAIPVGVLVVAIIAVCTVAGDLQPHDRRSRAATDAGASSRATANEPTGVP
jgi:ABC-type transport system involved in cytochrome bd biosynthesis fused ATPase/permease subunit